MAKGPEFLSSFTVMFQNPQLGKVMLASGLQAAASSVAIIFVTTGAKARFWGDSLSSIQAEFAMSMSFVGIFGGSLYGRFSDSVDRRLAAGIYGLLTFLPAWTFLIMGMTNAALTVSCIFQVLAGIGVGSNVLLVLAQDVAKPEEHEAAFGGFYMVNSLVNFILLGIPILLITVFKVVPASPEAILWYQVGLSAGFFFCITSVKMPAPKQVITSSSQGREEATLPEASSCSQDCEEATLPEVSNCSQGCEAESLPEASSCTSKPTGGRRMKGCLAQVLWKPLRNIVEPLRLGCGDANIRAFCFAAALVAFSSDLVMDVGGQYFQDSLGILPVFDHVVDEKAQELFAVLTMLPPQLAIIPAYAAMGWAMKRLGSKRLLQLLVPVSAVFTCIGGPFHIYASHFTLTVTVVLLSYAGLAQIPLLAFVQETAPEGRKGEAMGAVGSCQQLSNFAGNLVVSLLNPVLVRNYGSRSFWVYYPACGFLALTALVPISLARTPSPSPCPEDEVSNCSSESAEASAQAEAPAQRESAV